MITPLPGSPRPSRARRRSPLPGVSADVVDERPGARSTEGAGLLVLTRPWPSMLRTLYKDDDRYVETYWSRFGPTTYLVGRRRTASTMTATSGSSGASTT